MEGEEGGWRECGADGLVEVGSIYFGFIITGRLLRCDINIGIGHTCCALVVGVLFLLWSL